MSIVGKALAVEAPLVSVYPAEVDSTDDGSSVDCNAYSTQLVAIQLVGGVGGTNPELDGKIQESPDGGSWFDIEGAAFTQVTTSNDEQAILINRSMRYVRHSRVVAGTSPTFVLSAFFLPVTTPSGGRTIIVQAGPGVRVDVR